MSRSGLNPAGPVRRWSEAHWNPNRIYRITFTQRSVRDCLDWCHGSVRPRRTYNLVITVVFTKWTEALRMKTVRAPTVVKLIQDNVFMRTTTLWDFQAERGLCRKHGGLAPCWNSSAPRSIRRGMRSNNPEVKVGDLVKVRSRLKGLNPPHRMNPMYRNPPPRSQGPLRLHFLPPSKQG